jgi:protein-tyrosine phosphatase
MKKILFVCLGNICRSPAAEGIFQAKLTELKIEAQVYCDSAGTSGFHAGERADARMREHAKRRGYELLSRSRGVIPHQDFDEFDLILAMDQSNFENLTQMARTDKERSKIKKMLSYASGVDLEDVPDPYYGGEQGFEQVMDLLERACDGLIKQEIQS